MYVIFLLKNVLKKTSFVFRCFVSKIQIHNVHILYEMQEFEVNMPAVLSQKTVPQSQPSTLALKQNQL